ncbi:MAG TPA: DUF2846 domain-containing protein [Hanamia sp.]
MNKILSVFFVMLVSSSLYAQNSSESKVQTGKVYFIRSDAFPPLAGAYNVYIDDARVCRINNQRFSIKNVVPGTHIVSSQILGNKPGKKVDKDKKQIEAGKTYYIQVYYKHGLFSNKLKTKEIDEESAKKLLSKLKEVKNC